MSIIAAFARAALATAGRIVKTGGRQSAAPIRIKAGKVMKGSRRRFNDLWNRRYGKPLGRRTWAQIFETSSFQARNVQVSVDEDEDEDF